MTASPNRWCTTCHTSWRGADPCFACGREGVISHDPPEGWPRMRIAAAPVLPEPTVRR